MPDSDEPGSPPDPQQEPPEQNPGGADAVTDEAPYSAEDGGPLSHDLDPDDNPAVEDALPDEIKESDDEKTQDPDKDPHDDSDREDRPVEPPA